MDLDDEPAGETLAFGRDRGPRRRWVVVWVLVTAAVLGALAVDRGVRDREVDAMLADVGSVSAAVALADRRVSGMQQYLRPATSMENVGSGLAGDLEGLEADARDEGRREVLAQVALVEQDDVLPWHGDVADAQDRLITYVEAEADRLGATGDDRTAARATAADALAGAVGALRPLVDDQERSARLEESLGPLPGLDDLP